MWAFNGKRCDLFVLVLEDHMRTAFYALYICHVCICFATHTRPSRMVTPPSMPGRQDVTVAGAP